MHRVDSDEHLANKFQNANPPTTAGTLLEKDWHNAVQEDLCRFLETIGITLAASGTADQTAGWVSTRDALLLKLQGGDPRRFGAKGDGVTNDYQAFVDTIAQSNVLFIPEGEFYIGGVASLVLPDSAVVIGMGLNSKLKVDGSKSIFNHVDKSVMLRNFVVNGSGGTLPAQKLISLTYGAGVSDKQALIHNIFFNGLRGNGIQVSDANGGNNVMINECHFQNCEHGLVLGIGSTPGSKNHISSCSFRDCPVPLKFEDNETPSIITNCQIYDGDLEFDDSKAISFIGCNIDVDNYDFNNADGVVFTKCKFPNTLSNTIATDGPAKSSYFEFYDNQTDVSGEWLPGCAGGLNWYEELKGGFQQVRVTANSSLNAGVTKALKDANFTIATAQRVGMNDSQTKFAMWNGTTGLLQKKTGSGLVHFRIEFFIERLNASLDPIANLSVYFTISGQPAFGLGGTMYCAIAPMVGNSNKFAFNYYGSIYLKEGETLGVNAANDDGTYNAQVLIGSGIQAWGL